MRNCENCGKSSSEDALFCVNCGQHFQKDSTEPAATTSTQMKEEKSQSTFENKPTKKNKVLFSLLGVLALLAIIAHMVLSNIYDPAKRIQAMNNAYNTQDKEGFFNEFNVKKGTVANAQNFYTTVNDYGWTNLRDSLTYEVEKIKNNEPTNIIYHTGEFISVHNKPILFGLYHQVEFTIIPTEVSVYLPFKNMSIQFGDQKVSSDEDEQQLIIGYFIQGNYDWSYEYEDGLMPLSGKGSYTLHPQEDNMAVIDVDWDFITLTIESDVADAILYVDDQSTGKTVGELYEFYPAQIRPSSKIHAQVKDQDGNEVKSNVLPVDSDHLYLGFEHIQQEYRNAEHEDAIRRLFKNFRSDYQQAIYYTNFRYIEDYFKDGSQIKQDYAKFVTDHNKISGYHYEFLLNDITSFKAISDTKFELHSFETFNYTSADDGNIHYERKKKYTISYADGDYTIDEILDIDTKKQLINK